MPRESKTIKVNKTDANKYRKIAKGFYDAAISEIESRRWNAAGLLIVHSAIAYADALTIKYGGVKNKSENHQDVVKLLEIVVKESESKNNALNQLERLIAHKSTVAYSGEIYDEQDIEKLFKHLDRFKTWAEKQFTD
ncbi:MAG: HEPN domain-containing protein [Ignavibacteriales bacterium]|nr:HEPN domain-containing protein [Ignavibacteriales bacterium]